MGSVPFPAIDYTSRDYASLRQSMLDGATARLPEWQSRSPQDFGVVLVELFAVMGDILSYYIDRAANEAFLPTATQRSSVLKLAKLLNYRARATAAASTNVEFIVDPSLAGTTLEAGIVLRSRSSDGSIPVVFTTTAPVTVPVGITGATTVGPVAATQGYLRTETAGTSQGNFDETFVLQQAPVIEASLIVRVAENAADVANAPVWIFMDNLLDARPDDSAYTTMLDANGVLTIQFGDGVNGRIPPRDASILATYRVGGGTSGNVGAGTIVEMAEPIAGVLSVTNPDAASGGSDAESIESIRYNAPRSLQALNRAVTLADFATLAMQVPQVAKARAEAVTFTNVSLYIAPFGGGLTPQRLLGDVVSHLASRKLIGVDVVASGATYVPIDVTATVTVDSAYNASSVRTGVERALRTALGFDFVDFGQLVSISDVYAAMTAVPGVSSASLRRLSRRGLSGVLDVALSPHEIPTIGTMAITVIGGISGADPTGTGGTASVMPGASSAPTVILARCDSTTMHLELSWTPGVNTREWYLEVQYLDSIGSILSTIVIGPAYSPNEFIVDPASNTEAVSVGLRLQAFNGETGPVYSPITYIANPCFGA